MKYNRKLLLLAFSIILVSCENTSSSSFSNSSNSVSDTQSQNDSIEDTSTYSENKDKTKLDFYALNDFHGAIIPATEDQPGLNKIAGYLESVKSGKEDTTILLDIGDSWQGSADSNLTRGKIIIETYNELDFSAMTLGNHEFDWKKEAIIDNKAIANFPFLGANIFTKSDDKQASEITDGGSTIINKNGINIGLIGTIGSNLESSILATAVEEFYFSSVTDVIKSEAASLREKGADIIVLMTHDGLNDIGSPSSYSYKEYYPLISDENGNNTVDIIFSGHRHTVQNKVVNGVPILQTNGNGSQIMHVSLNVSNDIVELDSYSLITSNQIKASKDSEIFNNIYSKFQEEINIVKNEKLGTLDIAMPYKSKQLMKLVNTSMLDYSMTTSQPIDVVVYNDGGIRSGLPSGVITYGDIYSVLPFDNQLVVLENVTYNDLEFYNSSFYGVLFKDNKSLTDYNTNDTFNVLSIDYVTENKYGNFKNLKKKTLNGVFSRDVLRQFILKNNEIKYADYS